MTTTEKTALYLGIWGAALSTLNTVIQVINHRKDRANIAVRVGRNMVRTDRMDQKFTIVTAVNQGKRPVRIDGFAARQLDTQKNLLLLDIRPQIPYILEEAQSISAWIPESDALDKIETYFAYDSVGREFTHHMVSWKRRVISNRRRKREPIARAK